MDCKTARLLLAFARPQTGEMEEADALDLERHLAQCPECGEAARRERRIDQHLGKAMRQVEVPDRMKSAILARLADERGKWQRRWIHRIAQGAAAAAVLLVVLGAVWYWRSTHLPSVALDKLWEDLNHVNAHNPIAEIQASSRRQGLAVEAPPELNYNFLFSNGFAELQGQLVPRLVFVGAEGSGEKALVYILSNRQFNLSSLDSSPGLDSGELKVSVLHRPQARQALVIVHTGDLKWLIKNEPPAL